MTPPRAETVETAKRYPFPRPGHSFLFVDGEALPLLSLSESLEEAEIEVDGRAVPAGILLRERGIALPAPLARRTPVLAYGANAAPERLRRKFAPVNQTVFPVLNARLQDFDVVHAAHISSYGAVPATIEHSPGTVCDIAITFLDERELARMHETEFRRHTYLFGLLSNVRLEPDLLPAMDTVSSYVGGFGHIAPEGEAACARRHPGRGPTLPHLLTNRGATDDSGHARRSTGPLDCVHPGSDRPRCGQAPPHRATQGAGAALLLQGLCADSVLTVSRAPARRRCRRRARGRPGCCS